MPNFTYTSAIPSSTDVPSQSQSNLQTNCTSTNSILNVDLYGFNNANGGLHQQVTFAGNNPPSPSPPGSPITVSPPVLFTNTVDGAGNNLPNSVAELFLYSGTPAQGQNNYVSQSTGSVLLFGGIIMKWGQASVSAGSNQGVTFGAAGAFPNSCFMVQLTGRNGGNNTGGYNINGINSGPANGFTMFASSNGNVYWLAIGN